MDTYGSLHSGDVVQGADGNPWGVESVEWVSPARVQVAVVLFRHGQRVRGLPPAGMGVTVISRADVSAEYAAASAFIAAGLDVELIREQWQT